MLKSVFFLICCSVLFFSCSKKHDEHGKKYTFDELMALSIDAVELPKKVEDGGIPIDYSQYAASASQIESRGFRYRKLLFWAISFETEEDARKEAVRLNQYYSRNWLFDQVDGEPILEDYVIIRYGAINPNRKIQRVAKPLEKVRREDMIIIAPKKKSEGGEKAEGSEKAEGGGHGGGGEAHGGGEASEAPKH
jgi:uncharacterized membrane protein YgcG